MFLKSAPYQSKPPASSFPLSLTTEMLRPRLYPATSISQLFSVKLSTRILFSIWIVVVASPKACFVSVAHSNHHPNSGENTEASLQSLQWNKKQTQRRRLQYNPQLGNQIRPNNNVHRRILSTQESLGADPDDPMTDESDDANNDGSNDDVTVVVPWNFAQGETVDDTIYNESDDSSLSITQQFSETYGIENPSRISWFYAAFVILPIVGYLVYRRRQRSRRRLYRTHQILQEHVEAFDLSFRDEDDDVELSNF